MMLVPSGFIPGSSPWVPEPRRRGEDINASPGSNIGHSSWSRKLSDFPFVVPEGSGFLSQLIKKTLNPTRISLHSPEIVRIRESN